MITTNNIREDLRNIRYYYSRKNNFEQAESTVGKLSILDIIEKYNKIVCKAPPRLYDLYVSLYLENNTQESLADKIKYTPEYLSRLNRKLIKFIYENLLKEEEKNA